MMQLCPITEVHSRKAPENALAVWNCDGLARL